MKKITGVYNDNGYTRVRIWLGKKVNPDGTENKPYRKTFGLWTNENIMRAKNHVDDIRDGFKKGQKPQPEPQPVSFVAFSHIYFDKHWKNKRGRSLDSIQNTGYLLARFRSLWASYAWHTFTPQTFEDYVVARLKEGASSGTVNKELAILSSMFSMFNRWNNRREIGPFLSPTTIQGDAYNPCEDIERQSTVSSKRERVASEIELIRVKQFCDAHDDTDMILIIVRALLTGLRRRDLERVNGLSDVRGILSKSAEKKLFRFNLDFSQKLNYTNFDRRWYTLRQACDMLEGEKNFHWHDWRHTSATMLSGLGFSDEDIRRFLGQSDVETTRIYINRKDHLKPQTDAIQGHINKLFKNVPVHVAPDPAQKACRGCSVIKPLGEYYRHSAFKSGLDSQCKDCRKEDQEARRAADPQLRSREWARLNEKDPGLKERNRDRVRAIRQKAKAL